MPAAEDINQNLPLTQITPAALEAADGDDESTMIHHSSVPASPSGGVKHELGNEKALSQMTSRGSKRLRQFPSFARMMLTSPDLRHT